MRTIYLPNRNMTGQGGYSGYFKLNARQGVKVYGMGNPEWNSYEYKKHIEFWQVRKDFKLIKSMRTRLVPKVYEVVAVYSEGEWFPGIVMQHCAGTTLRKAVGDYRADAMLYKIGKAFEKKTNYRHEDLHSNNVMYNKKTKTYKVIDISEVTYIGREAA